jgi:hypothetical protein
MSFATSDTEILFNRGDVFTTDAGGQGFRSATS